MNYLTIEQIDKRLAEIEPLEDQAFELDKKAQEARRETLENWHAFYTERNLLKARRAFLVELKDSWKGSEALPV